MPATSPFQVTVTASGHLTREAWVTWRRGERTGITLDLIAQKAPFRMTFYRAFARDGYADPGDLDPLWIWRTAPSFYIRTLDDRGRSVEPSVISTIARAIRTAVPQFTGGTYGVASLQTGTERRPEREGWVNVDIVRELEENYCGLAYIGGGGPMTLRYDACSCGSTKISPDVVAHEVGHVMGFFHVPDRQNVMYPFDGPSCRAAEPSAAERHHAAVAYSRSRGNMDPDRDPSEIALVTPRVRVPN